MKYNYTDKANKHLHSLDGKPLMGVSSVCKILGKGDALTWWASGMCAANFGWRKKSDSRVMSKEDMVKDEEARLDKAVARFAELTALEDMEYLALLDEAYKAHDTYKREKAKLGTARHEALEKYVKECLSANKVIAYEGDNEFVKKFAEWAKENIEKFLWSEIHCYSETLWVGGIADVGWIDKQGRVIAGDFKSSKEAYFEQFIQIAGYDLLLSGNGGYDADGNKTFSLVSVGSDLLFRPIVGYCVIPFGADELVPEFQYDVESYRIGFEQAVALYKLSEEFDNK